MFQMINVPYIAAESHRQVWPALGWRWTVTSAGVIDTLYARLRTAIYSPRRVFLTDHVVSGGARHSRRPGLVLRGVINSLEMARALSFLKREGTHTLTRRAIRFILMHQGVTGVVDHSAEVTVHLQP